MTQKTSWLVLVMILLWQGIAAHADECTAIMQRGIYDTRQSRSAEDRAQSFSDWFCSIQSDSEAQNISAILGIKVYSGSFAQGSFKDSHREFCRDTRSSASRLAMDENFTRTINPQIIQAVEKCMTRDGLHIWLEVVTSKEFILAARFIPTSDKTNARVTSFQARHASCQADPMSWKIGAATQRTICDRQDKEAVVIAITADENPHIPGDVLMLPAIPTPTVGLSVVGKMTNNEGFKVLFNSSFPSSCDLGSIPADSTFTMRYDRNRIAWIAIGPFGGVQATSDWGWQNSPNRTGAPYPPERHMLIIGGGGFRFDDNGRVFRSCDDTESQVGRIVFNEDN